MDRKVRVLGDPEGPHQQRDSHALRRLFSAQLHRRLVGSNFAGHLSVENLKAPTFRTGQDGCPPIEVASDID